MRGSEAPCPVRPGKPGGRAGRQPRRVSVVSEPRPEHQPVLLAEVLRYLDPRPSAVVLDGTVGLGGHAAAIVPRILPGGRYVGLDLDEEMLRGARERLAGPVASGDVTLVAANYAEFAEVLARLGLRGVDRVVLDLGVNSAQLAEAGRGFSFERDGPLDMRYDRRQTLTAADLVNSLPERELADVFFENAQERLSRKIARRICQVRREGRITTTLALARAVASAVGAAGAGRPGGLHPATRVFQALRIAVNRELDNLRLFLERLLERLNPGGRAVFISFHSLEDGLVKRAIRGWKAAGRVEELTPRPVLASPAERRANPRSRSAKLRAFRRLE